MNRRTGEISPDETAEIKKQPTEVLEKDARTGRYVVGARTGNLSVKKVHFTGEVPPATSTDIKRHSRKLSFFRKNRDVDALVSEQLVTVHPKPVDCSPASTDGKIFLLQDVYEEGPVFAEGGQGILKLGTDRRLKRTAAIKSLRLTGEADDERRRKAFLQEAKVTAQLDHPAITTIYSLNLDNARNPNLAMRYIKGYTLKQYLERLDSFYRIDGIDTYDERKSLFYRLDLFLRVCDALSYAHSRNLMHCDLKPENIMIGEYREVTIMDWGIAHSIRDASYDPATWTAPQKIVGTPRYLSPEVINGLHCDERADIFALGLILFEIVTLREAYSGSNSEQVIMRIREGEMNDIEHRWGFRIDSDLKAIVEKATATARDERYSSAAELAADLRRYMRNEEVSAKPDSIPAKIVRWCALHPRHIVVLGFLLLLLAAFAVTSSLVGQIRDFHAHTEREFAMNGAFARCVFTAKQFDSLFREQEQLLNSLTSEFMLLLRQPIVPKEEPKIFPWNVQTPENPARSQSLIFAPAYHRPVDFSHATWKSMDEKLTAEQQNRLAKINLMLPRFRHSILTSPMDVPASGKGPELLDRAIHKGVPMHLAIFGFTDGLFYIYPGVGTLGENFDPRTRTWYTTGKASEPGMLRWTKPYLSIYRKAGYLLSCAMPMHDGDGKFLGVAAVELLVDVLLRDLENKGNRSNAVIGKFLIDAEDNLLLSTDNSLNPIKQADDLYGKFPDSAMLAKMRKSKYGFLTTYEDGKEILWCYAPVQSMEWLYLEKFDFAVLRANEKLRIK